MMMNHARKMIKLMIFLLCTSLLSSCDFATIVYVENNLSHDILLRVKSNIASSVFLSDKYNSDGFLEPYPVSGDEYSLFIEAHATGAFLSFLSSIDPTIEEVQYALSEKRKGYIFDYAFFNVETGRQILSKDDVLTSPYVSSIEKVDKRTWVIILNDSK